MNQTKLIPFNRTEIQGVNYRLSNDVPVKLFFNARQQCTKIGFYILEELAIGHRYPHITFILIKNRTGYRLTDLGEAQATFGHLINLPIIKSYRERLGIAFNPKGNYYYIQMPLLNSIEAYTHRLLEFLTQLKTVADLKHRNLLK